MSSESRSQTKFYPLLASIQVLDILENFTDHLLYGPFEPKDAASQAYFQCISIQGFCVKMGQLLSVGLDILLFDLPLGMWLFFRKLRAKVSIILSYTNFLVGLCTNQFHF